MYSPRVSVSFVRIYTVPPCNFGSRNFARERRAIPFTSVGRNGIVGKIRQKGKETSRSFCLQVVEKEKALGFYKNKLVKILLSARARNIVTCV